MSLEIQLTALTAAVGADIKALRAADGDLASLPTTAKSNLVAAIAEVFGMVTSGAAVINDAAGDGDDDVTWSANKIFDEIALAAAAVKAELRDGAGAALDTFAEVAAQLAADQTAAAALATAVGNRVRFDEAQALNDTQKSTARSNIGAASATDLDALEAAVGDTEQDLVAAYNAAKA